MAGNKIRCEYGIPGQEIWELKGDQYKGCPFRIITRQTVYFLKAFNFYRQGYLPNEGGWLSQPAKLLDAFEVIETELRSIRDERTDRKALSDR